METINAEVKKELITSEVKQEMSKALEILGQITEINITTEEENQNAVTLCGTIKATVDHMEGLRKEIVGPLNDQVKVVNGEFKTVTERLNNGILKLRTAISARFAENERNRRIEQAKLEAEAEEARKKAQAQADAEAAKAKAYQEQGREDMAAKATARAEVAMDKAATTVAPVVQQSKAAGSAFRKEFRLKVADRMKVILACMANPMLHPAIVVDSKAIEKIANATKQTFPLDGAEWTEEIIPVISIRR